MRTRIIRIGNSHGVRIPKALLQEVGLGTEVELELRDDYLILRPADRPRSGWEESFRAMADAGDDSLLDREELPATRWDEESWQW